METTWKCWLGKVSPLAIIAMACWTISITADAMVASEEPSQSMQEIRELPGSAEPTPERKELEKQLEHHPTSPPERPSLQALEEIIKSQAGGSERLGMAKRGAKGPALPGSRQLPSELMELEKVKEHPHTPSARPTLQELEEIIKKQPGGAERLNMSKKRMAPRRGPQHGSLLDRGKALLLSLNPLRTARADAGQTLTLNLSPEVDSNGRHAGMCQAPGGAMNVYGGCLNCAYPDRNMMALYGVNKLWPDGTRTSVSRPFVAVTISIATAGWYIINVTASHNGTTKLYHFGGNATTSLGAFPSQGPASPAQMHQLPTLQYLAPGDHTFYWVFSGAAFVHGATVDSTP